MTFKKISGWLTVVAIGTLFFRRGLFHPFILQPFEILILLASAFGLISMIKSGVDKETRLELLRWGKGFLLFFLSLGLGLVYSLVLYGLDKQVTVGLLKDFFVLFSSALAFLLVLYHKNSARFIKNSLLSSLSPILFAPILLFPIIILFLNITEGGGYLFLGFHDSRTAFGNFLLFPFAVLIAYTLKEQNVKKKSIGWIGLVIISAFMLWTGARNAYVGGVLISFFVLFFAVPGTRKLKWIGKSVLLLIFVVISAYLILPERGKNTVILRMFPQFSYLSNMSNLTEEELSRIGATPELLVSGYNPNTFLNTTRVIIPSIGNEDLLNLVSQNPHPDLGLGNRPFIWLQSVYALLKNPLGFSSQFENITQLKVSPDSSGTGGSHNTFLQLALSGGWLALLLLLTFIYKMFKSLRQSRNNDWEWLALAGANFGMFINFFFDDRMLSPWVWVITSLAIAYTYTQGRHGEISDKRTSRKNVFIDA